MLRMLFILIPSLLIACYKDQSSPTAPMGKANCPLCGLLDSEFESQGGRTSTDSDTTQIDSEDSGDFNIEIIFPSEDHFTPQEKQKILDAAKKWEEVVVGDMPSFTVPYDLEYIEPPFALDEDGSSTTIRISEGEVIDDIRIYVLRGETSYDQWWGWSYAAASYYKLNPETDLVSIGIITYAPEEDFYSNEEWIEIGRNTFYHTAVHEIGHVLGIGLGPQWDQFVVPGIKKYSIMQQTDLTRWGGNFFTGPKAWEALQRQPIYLMQYWVGSDGNPDLPFQYRPSLLARYPNAQTRIIGTYENPGTMEELYTFLDKPPYVGIGNGVPIRHHSYHWEYLVWSDYMSELSLVPGQRAIRDISEVTLGALDDMGYVVDYGKADLSPLHIWNVQYVEYLDPDFALHLMACSEVGSLAGFPCTDENRDYYTYAAKAVVPQQHRAEYRHMCGIRQPESH